ncbi:MAG: hypothetical protein KDA66_20695, partial [Planctomycetaceae bacterium]|nr:hypothetical protein [Planctomycetaceae bacterium]
MTKGSFWRPFPREELQFRCLRYWTTFPGDIDGHHEARRDELAGAVQRLLQTNYKGLVRKWYPRNWEGVMSEAVCQLTFKLMSRKAFPVHHSYIALQLRGAASTLLRQDRGRREGFKFEEIFDNLTESEIRRPASDGANDGNKHAFLWDVMQHLKLESWEQAVLGGLLAEATPDVIRREVEEDFPNVAAQLTDSELLKGFPDRLHQRIRQMAFEGAECSKSSFDVTQRAMQTFDHFLSGMLPSQISEVLNVSRPTTTRDLNRVSEWIAGQNAVESLVEDIRDFLNTWREFCLRPDTTEAGKMQSAPILERADEFRERLLECLSPEDWQRSFLAQLHEPAD